MFNFEEVDLTDSAEYTTDFMKATYESDICDNFVLEMHYKIYFEAVSVEQYESISSLPADYSCSSGAI